MRTPHTSCKRGKRVKIITRSGERIISKFIEKKGENIVLENGTYTVSEIRSFSIYKPTTNQ